MIRLTRVKNRIGPTGWFNQSNREPAVSTFWFDWKNHWPQKTGKKPPEQLKPVQNRINRWTGSGLGKPPRLLQPTNNNLKWPNFLLHPHQTTITHSLLSDLPWRREIERRGEKRRFGSIVELKDLCFLICHLRIEGLTSKLSCSLICLWREQEKRLEMKEIRSAIGEREEKSHRVGVLFVWLLQKKRFKTGCGSV